MGQSLQSPWGRGKTASSLPVGSLAVAATLCLLLIATAARSQTRQSDETTVGTGVAGSLRVVSSSDVIEVRELLEDWRTRNPDIKLTYVHKNSL